MNGLYFSGNGNTKHCIELFCSKTGGQAFSIENPEALSLLKNDEEIALAYPIHYSNIPVIMKSFILKHGEFFKDKKIFIIATMGLFSGDGAGCSARLLKKEGAEILGALHLKMPDCIGDVKMLKKSLIENQEIIRKSEEKIINLAYSLMQSKTEEKKLAKGKSQKYPKDGLFFWNQIAGLFGQRLWFKKTARDLRSKLNINLQKCIGCGKCASGCPTQAIQIINGKALFSGSLNSSKGKSPCTICYRCINKCPAKAITLIGKKVLEQCCFEKYQKS